MSRLPDKFSRYAERLFYAGDKNKILTDSSDEHHVVDDVAAHVFIDDLNEFLLGVDEFVAKRGRGDFEVEFAVADVDSVGARGNGVAHHPPPERFEVSFVEAALQLIMLEQFSDGVFEGGNARDAGGVFAVVPIRLISHGERVLSQK